MPPAKMVNFPEFGLEHHVVRGSHDNIIPYKLSLLLFSTYCHTSADILGRCACQEFKTVKR